MSTSQASEGRPITVLTGSAVSHTRSSSRAAMARASAAHQDTRERFDRLNRTLQSEVIPRLVRLHEGEPASLELLDGELGRFVDLLVSGSDGEVNASVDALHRRGLSVTQVFTQVLSPAARLLGERWDDDQCDFPTVTICLGRLQRLLREWAPAFNRECGGGPNGRSVLLAQHREEQHSFGLSMVAEFFRADGWSVLGGVGAAVPDLVARVNREWFDVLGISIGTDLRVEWLREQVVRARAGSRNPHLLVLVGGPIFLVKPQLAATIGADAACEDGSLAPALCARLLKARQQAA
ncbi:MAG: cobalamin-dependent protein [Rubrivivax sp.]|nr:cobalamin-dependent protein [Rubrivivax sp.]